MKWKDLKARLSDPIVSGGLLLLVIGEIQAQSNVLLDWLSPTAAGRVLIAVGSVAATLAGLIGAAISKLVPWGSQ